MLKQVNQGLECGLGKLRGVAAHLLVGNLVLRCNLFESLKVLYDPSCGFRRNGLDAGVSDMRKPLIELLDQWKRKGSQRRLRISRVDLLSDGRCQVSCQPDLKLIEVLE